jgi:ribose/xylose/arabinose/galactoside ABC-type transport system permease subunit
MQPRTLPSWKVLMVCVLLAVVVGSFLVGQIASRHEGFDWELAAIVGTAIGTTLLAAATGALALSDE